MERLHTIVGCMQCDEPVVVTRLHVCKICEYYLCSDCFDDAFHEDGECVKPKRKPMPPGWYDEVELDLYNWEWSFVTGEWVLISDPTERATDETKDNS